VPTADNLVHLTVAGGTIVALDNGDIRDHDPYRTDSRRAFNGRGLAILRASVPGPLTVTASADGLREARVTIQVVRGTPPEAIPPAR